MSINNFRPANNFLQNKTILVTGAGDGIGAQVAIAYASYGATVVLLGRTITKLEAVYDKIEAAGGPKPAIYPLNLEGACDQDYDEMASVIKSELGQLNGILHNAAYIGDSTSIRYYDTAQWQRELHINLTAPFMLTRSCLELLKISADPRILFTTHLTRTAYWGAYSVAKAGIECLMQILADELNSDRPVTVNAISPGELQSPLTLRSYPGKSLKSFAKIATVIPTYLYLMSQASCGLTGKIVDGSGNIV